MLKDFDSAELCDMNVEISKMTLITQQFVDQWLVDVNRNESRTGNGGYKLRTYRSFKQNFQLENYCKSVFN